MNSKNTLARNSASGRTDGGFFSPGFAFVLPGLLGLLLFFVLPFCLSLAYAFMDRPVNGSFAAFANFTALFQSRAWRTGMINTLRFTGAAALLNMGISLALALLINKITKYREWFTLVFLAPLVIPSGSMVFFWKSLFSWDGALNGLFVSLGAKTIAWLDSGIAFPVMLLIFLWKNAGYNMVLFLSALGKYSEGLLRSRMDGQCLILAVFSPYYRSVYFPRIGSGADHVDHQLLQNIPGSVPYNRELST